VREQILVMKFNPMSKEARRESGISETETL